MTTTISKAITAVYVGMYNRAADQDGYNWWLNGFGGNPDAPVTADQMQSLAAGFANNPYFTSAYPESMSNTDFINQLYVNIGGNAGDTAGVGYWEDRLQALEGDRVSMVAEFIYGFISIDLTSQGSLSATDYSQAKQRQDSLLNKITVSESFRDQLGSHSNPTETDPSQLDQDPTFQLSREVIADVNSGQMSVINAVINIHTIASDIAPAAIFNDRLNDASNTTPTGVAIDTHIIGSVGTRISATETDTSDTFTFVAPRDGTVMFKADTGGAQMQTNAGILLFSTVHPGHSDRYVDFETLTSYEVGGGPVFEGEIVSVGVWDHDITGKVHDYSIEMWMV